MVANQGQHAWIVTNQGHDTGRVRAAVNRVPEEDKPVLLTQMQPMHQRSKRRKMTVHVTDGEDAVASIEATLEVGFQRVIPPTKVRRELFFARQGFVHQGEDSP